MGLVLCWLLTLRKGEVGISSCVCEAHTEAHTEYLEGYSRLLRASARDARTPSTYFCIFEPGFLPLLFLGGASPSIWGSGGCWGYKITISGVRALRKLMRTTNLGLLTVRKRAHYMARCARN